MRVLHAFVGVDVDLSGWWSSKSDEEVVADITRLACMVSDSPHEYSSCELSGFSLQKDACSVHFNVSRFLSVQATKIAGGGLGCLWKSDEAIFQSHRRGGRCPSQQHRSLATLEGFFDWLRAEALWIGVGTGSRLAGVDKSLSLCPRPEYSYRFVCSHTSKYMMLQCLSKSLVG